MCTALVYHEDMMGHELLWDDPECKIEGPQRLSAALDRLRQCGLEQRCLRLSAREASEAELGLVHSPEYIALIQGTQVLGKGELQVLSGQYDAVYFHPSTFHCARLAVGAALQLVDAVLTGAVHNGLALVRPPGHHSQRAAANGFCVFNNVAIAAEHAKQKHGLCRILIVDWDIHHGQGIQYIFEDDPSVLYFSWHRYEHGRFWPFLRESNADAVGRGRGRGFTVNLPWNEVGMGNAEYMAAFLHLLLPLAFEFDPELVLVSAGFDSAIGDPEGQMQATPECFAHLTQLLQVLAGGRVCAVLEVTGEDEWARGLGLTPWEYRSPAPPCLEQQARWAFLARPCIVKPLPSSQGGYHLESLAESVCMTVQALLGDPAPPLLGPLMPSQSALESIQSVRAVQAPHWLSLQQQDVDPALSSSTHFPEGRLLPVLPGGPACKAEASAVLTSLLGQLYLHPTPAVCTAPDATLVLPHDVISQESAPREEAETWARPRASLAQDEALTTLAKLLYLLDGILDGQVSSGIAATPPSTAAAILDVAIQRGLSHGAQRLFCVALGQLDQPPDLTDDGRTLWLSIRGKEAVASSAFHVSTPLPGTSGGFLSCLLGLVLPLAYGFQPDLVLVVLGPAHGLQGPHAALLAAVLRVPAGGRVLVLVEESEPQLAGMLAPVLRGEAPPSLGPFSIASPEDVQAIRSLRGQLERQWKMLQVAVPLSSGNVESTTAGVCTPQK